MCPGHHHTVRVHEGPRRRRSRYRDGLAGATDPVERMLRILAHHVVVHDHGQPAAPRADLGDRWLEVGEPMPAGWSRHYRRTGVLSDETVARRFAAHATAHAVPTDTITTWPGSKGGLFRRAEPTPVWIIPAAAAGHADPNSPAPPASGATAFCTTATPSAPRPSNRSVSHGS